MVLPVKEGKGSGALSFALPVLVFIVVKCDSTGEFGVARAAKSALGTCSA